MTTYSVFVGIPRDISLVAQSWIVNSGRPRLSARICHDLGVNESLRSE